jgi:hypothetical protein
MRGRGGDGLPRAGEGGARDWARDAFSFYEMFFLFPMNFYGIISNEFDLNSKMDFQGECHHMFNKQSKHSKTLSHVA